MTRDPGGLAWIVLTQDRHLDVHYGGAIATLTLDERWTTPAEERGEVVVALTHLPFTEDADPRAHYADSDRQRVVTYKFIPVRAVGSH